MFVWIVLIVEPNVVPVIVAIIVVRVLLAPLRITPVVLLAREPTVKLVFTLAVSPNRLLPILTVTIPVPKIPPVHRRVRPFRLLRLQTVTYRFG